jgi:hypothetical protein
MSTRLIWIHHFRHHLVVGRCQSQASEVSGEPCNAAAASESTHVGFAERGSISFARFARWTITYTIPLPRVSNLPPGLLWDTFQVTLDNFFVRLSEWSGQPVSDLAWFRNGLTQAWVKPAAIHPE